MADAGLSAPPAPQQRVQPTVPPNQPIPAQPIQHMPQLNWSHFKPAFAGKPDEDAEAHLLRTNDWMDMHAFQESVKSPMFLSYINGGSKIMV